MRCYSVATGSSMKSVRQPFEADIGARRGIALSNRCGQSPTEPLGATAGLPKHRRPSVRQRGEVRRPAPTARSSMRGGASGAVHSKAEPWNERQRNAKWRSQCPGRWKRAGAQARSILTRNCGSGTSPPLDARLKLASDGTCCGHWASVAGREHRNASRGESGMIVRAPCPPPGSGGP
jgi:hypothetical protein